MNSSAAGLLEEVLALANASLFSQATAEEIDRLEQLVLADDQACRLYVDVMFDAQQLRHWSADSAYGSSLDAGPLVLPPSSNPIVYALPTGPQQEGRQLPLSPGIGSLGSTIHGAIGYFSQGMPLAYLLATVLTGFGLWIGSLIYVSHPEQVARRPVPSVVVEAKIEPVGRVTGMVDCQWEKEGPGVRGQGSGISNLQSPIPNPQSLVSLGQNFALASGLMEITYNTGAKVILQGPVTYEVESNGGYLSIGRLTGKLEKRGGGPAARGEKGVLSSSFILHPSSFVIRTPTATVTDLGTEFGVEVSRNGATETHVFVGEVRIASGQGQGLSGDQTRLVHAGQFAYVAPDQRLSVGERQAAEVAKRFARAMPGQLPSAEGYSDLVLSMNPVVYYRMEAFPKGSDADTHVLVDSAPGGHHGVLHCEHAFSHKCRGRFGYALDLHRAGREFAIVPDYPKTQTGKLAVSAWVRAASLSPWASIVQNWWSDNSNVRGGDTGQFYLGLDGTYDLQARVRQENGAMVVVSEGAEEPLPRGMWQHVAFVADGAVLRLYRNGVEVAAAPYRGIAADGQSPKDLCIGCQTDESGLKARDWEWLYWDGQLDEIAVFNHALTATQVWQLYAGSDAVKPPVAKQDVALPPPAMEEKGGSDKH